MSVLIPQMGKTANVLGSFNKGFDRGQALRRDKETRETLNSMYGEEVGGLLANRPDIANVISQIDARDASQAANAAQAQQEAQKAAMERARARAPEVSRIAQQLQGIAPEQRIDAFRSLAEPLIQNDQEFAQIAESILADGTFDDEELAMVQQRAQAFMDEPDSTSAMKEAAAIGLQRGTPEYEQFIRDRKGGVNVNLGSTIFDTLPKPAQGQMYRMTPDGGLYLNDQGLPELIDLPGARPSESEVRAGGASGNMEALESNIEQVLARYPDYDPTALKNVPGNISNLAASEAHQQYRAAADEWTTNMVFLRSGATAREEEKESAFRNFFPQPGDGPETVEFKKQLRSNAAKLAKQSAGRAKREIPKKEPEPKKITTQSGATIEFKK